VSKKGQRRSLGGAILVFIVCTVVTLILFFSGKTDSQEQTLLAVFSHGVTLSMGAIFGFSR